MKIVVDASVALKWVVDEPDSEAAFALHNDDLIAPALWLTEAANGLWRRVRIRDLTAKEAARRFAELEAAPLISLPIEPYVGSALRLANELNHPIYDCLYLSVALRNETYVVTADRRFIAAANRPDFVGRVRLLGS